MIKLLTAVIACFWATSCFSQVKIKVINAETKEPLAGASVSLPNLNKTGITDSTGIVVFPGITHDTHHTFIISYVGFATARGALGKGKDDDDSIDIIPLEPEEEEEEEVVIRSTRSSRSIQNIPTRVEFVAGEELDEKSNMKPGDIRMVLNESTGILTQQTSATSANAAIRIQGLDGRYTQILRDGLPLYAGFSGGLGLLQTPPLDLKQFEVIKGSSSTLYGGGAIAGLVNLISKTPGDEGELKFHFDATSAGGLNTSGFYGKKFNKIGLTLFATRNSNAPYDPADIGLTAIPKFVRHSVRPRFFFYLGDKTELIIGGSFVSEERRGGNMEHTRSGQHLGFYEINSTNRYTTEFSLSHVFKNKGILLVKNSYSYFERFIYESSFTFGAEQQSTFSEISYAQNGNNTEWVGGVSLFTDHLFEVRFQSANILRDYDQLNAGAFLQNTWRVNEKFHLETGIRGEKVKDYGFILLPRVSGLFKFNSKLSSRIGGGLGYKTPNSFTEESERLQYRNVLPVDKDLNKLERSYGVNADINFKTKIAGGKIDFHFNHLFFYTRIADPLLLRPEGSFYRFNTINGHIDSKGMETNLRLGYHDFKLFLGYTFTRAYLHEGATKSLSFLNPTHRLNSVLLYEQEEKWKLGLEAYYFSKQDLSDGTKGRSYWVTGFMAEKLWEKISLYINFENFLDARQTRWGSIYTGTIDSPVFKDIYAPLDGFVVNGGVKLRL